MIAVKGPALNTTTPLLWGKFRYQGQERRGVGMEREYLANFLNKILIFAKKQNYHFVNGIENNYFAKI